MDVSPLDLVKFKVKRSGVKTTVSLWTCASEALPLRCLSNFRAVGQFWNHISWLQEITRSGPWFNIKMLSHQYRKSYWQVSQQQWCYIESGPSVVRHLTVEWIGALNRHGYLWQMTATYDRWQLLSHFHDRKQLSPNFTQSCSVGSCGHWVQLP